MTFWRLNTPDHDSTCLETTWKSFEPVEDTAMAQGYSHNDWDS